MKIVSQGEIDEALRNRIEDSAPNVNLVSTGSQEELLREIGDADAFLGQITPALLSAAGKLQWVQASIENLFQSSFHVISSIFTSIDVFSFLFIIDIDPLVS